MKRLILLFLLSSRCLASDQIIISGVVAASSDSAEEFMPLIGGPSGGQSGTDLFRQQLISSTGTFKSLIVSLNQAPGAGNSYTFAARKDGVDTAVTCTISDASTSCSDLTNSFAVSPGERVSIGSIPSSTPAASTPTWSVMFLGNVTKESVLGYGTGTGLSDSAVRYAPLIGSSSPNATELNTTSPVASTGTISRLFVRLDNTPGAGKSYAFAFRKNGSDTALTCTISDSDTTCSDQTNSVAVTTGDLISLGITPSGTPTSRPFRAGVTFTSARKGEYFTNVSVAANASASNTHYTSINAASESSGTNENVKKQLAQRGRKQIQITGLVVVGAAAPGAAKSWTITLRKNNADTALTCAISGASETSCSNFATSVSATDLDALSIQIVPSGTPTATRLRSSLRVVAAQRRITND